MVTAVAFVAGALFGYFGVLPAAIDLLVRGFEARRMFEAYIKISAFTGFALKLMAAFGLAFELPVVMFILGRLGVINRRQVWSGARYALVLIFLAAAVLTPPDVATQFVLAVPLFALYVLGAVAVTLFGKREAPARPDETANGEAESTGGASTESREDAPQ
jgi:sec-independent protein translocase protein TatC